MDTNHVIDYDPPVILGSDQDHARVYVKESLNIRQLSAHLLS